MGEGKKDIYVQLHQNQNQFVFLILAVDVSAIGFTINKVVGEHFHVQQIFLGAAVICWTTSFQCGCYYIENKSKSMAGNLMMFDMPENIKTLKEIADELSAKGQKRYKLMKRLLYFGSICFILWLFYTMVTN